MLLLHTEADFSSSAGQLQGQGSLDDSAFSSWQGWTVAL